MFASNKGNSFGASTLWPMPQLQVYYEFDFALNLIEALLPQIYVQPLMCLCASVNHGFRQSYC